MTDRTTRTRTDGPRTRRRFLALAGIGLGPAVAGCSSPGADRTTTPGEATATIRLRNRDEAARTYEVVVRQGESLRDEFSGVIPAGQRIKMVATVRATEEQHDFSISSEGGQRGRTWDPTECADFVVDAAIRNGEPEFETTCRNE